MRDSGRFVGKVPIFGYQSAAPPGRRPLMQKYAPLVVKNVRAAGTMAVFEQQLPRTSAAGGARNREGRSNLPVLGLV